MPSARFLVARNDLRQVRIVADEAEAAPLADGEARLRIDGFALTSNNITYGAFGESMHYWDFFPSGVDGWGSIPVWGYAEVSASRAGGVAPGERFYGYFPMASEVSLRPVHVGDAGFVDGAAHRRELPALYNRYTRCRSDASYRPEVEAETALLRPLFITSFLIDDFLPTTASSAPARCCCRAPRARRPTAARSSSRGGAAIRRRRASSG
jgi:hypothetical protein